VGIKRGELYWKLTEDGKIGDLVVAVEPSVADPFLWWVMASDGQIVRSVSWLLVPLKEDDT
jgi:hypothetical protein